MAVILVKGNSVKAQTPLAEGMYHDEAITSPQSENMSIGPFKVDAGIPEMEFTFTFEEIEYLTEGSLVFTDEKGNKYKAENGDFICFTKGAKVKFSSETGCKGISVIYPCNWRELSAEKTK